MKVAVVGAYGFLGRHLSKLIEKESHQVFRLSLRETVKAESICKLRELSLELDAIVFCSGVINGPEPVLKEANTNSVREVVQLFKNKPNIRWIHISSVSAVHRLGPYGQTKQDGDNELIQSYLQNWAILRPSLIYGPGDSKNLISLLNVIRKSPVTPVPYDANIYIQPLYVEDVGRAVLRLLTEQKWKKKVWVMGGPEPIRTIDLAHKIKDLIQSHTWIIPIPLPLIKLAAHVISKFVKTSNFPLQQFKFMHAHPPWDSAEIQADLGFHMTSLEKGLHATCFQAKDTACAES